MSEFATFRAPRRIADFTAQVTIEESHQDDLTVSDHPVERGSQITDNAFKNPARLNMVVGWSNSGPDTANSPDQVDDYVRAVYARLLALQATREPFKVTTGKRAYENMLITSIALTTDSETENALIVSLGLREIIIVETQTVSVPPREVQATPEKTAARVDAGTKQAVPAKNANRTALKALVSG